MSAKYMLDTNIASFLIKGSSTKLEQTIRYIPISEMCISVITRAELLYGVVRMPQATRLAQSVNDFLQTIEILPWDNFASDEYAILRADLEKRGEVIGSLDMQISAHALAQSLTLITNNTREFKRVTGLQIEDWTQ